MTQVGVITQAQQALLSAFGLGFRFWVAGGGLVLVGVTLADATALAFANPGNVLLRLLLLLLLLLLVIIIYFFLSIYYFNWW